MRISELSAATQVPVATLKYYLREGVLHAGTVTSRTQARYNESHVERVRLIRALLESGQLSLARVRSVLQTLDGPDLDRLELLGVAQAAITPPLPDHPDPEWTKAATDFVNDHGWEIDPSDPLLVLLGDQLRMIAAGGVNDCDTLLPRYAVVADAMAQIDLDTVPDAPAAALRQVTIGTVLTDPMILTLRRLAQQGLSHRMQRP